MSRYALETIPVVARPLVDVNGAPLRYSDGTNAGAILAATAAQPGSPGAIQQWMDAAAFAAWVGYARQQYTAAVANQDPAALQASAKAVMAAYNELNIPWEIDPQARALYQRMVPGPPAALGSDTANFGGGAGKPYNDTTWLGPDYGRCIVIPGVIGGASYGGCTSDNGDGPGGPAPLRRLTGVLPINARNRFIELVGDVAGVPIQYLPRMQFVLRVPDGQSQLSPHFAVGADPPVPYPYDPALLTASVVFNDVLWRTERKQHYRHADGSDAAGDPDGWDVVAYDLGAISGSTVPEQFRLSWLHYAGWLNQWIAALEGRTAQQVVLDARNYALYRNVRTYQTNGGSSISSLAGAIVANLGTLTTGSASLRTDLQVAAAATAATGAALAPATFGISALIGGAVAALMTIGSVIVPPNLNTISIDDLERPKPWIERAWLGGSPADVTTQNGPPALDVPDPPGWTRPAVYRNLAVASSVTRNLAVINAVAAQNAPPPVPTPGAQLGALAGSVPEAVWIGAGLAIGAAGLYAGYRLTQGGGAPAPRSPRRSSSRRRSR